MEWSKDQIITLISQYEKHLCLWDSSNMDYKNRSKKKIAWMEIAAYMGLDAEAVDKKMKCILVQYRRERKKLADAIRSGTDEIRLPKWFAYESLTFLDGICKPKKTMEPLDEKLFSEERDCEEDSVQDSDHEDAKLPPANFHMLQELNNKNEDQDRTFKSPEKLNTSVKRKKTYEDGMDQACSVMESVLRMKKHRARDEFTAFGEIVGMKLRNLPTQFERSMVQHKINTLLFEAEMGKFRPHDSKFPSQEQSPVRFSNDSPDYSITTSPSSVNSPICNIIINDIPASNNGL